MKRYLTLAAIGFALGFAIFQFVFAPSMLVHWWDDPVTVASVFSFCLHWACALSFPAVFHDILVRHGVWARPRWRMAGTFVFGATIGIYFLILIAVLDSNGTAVELANCDALFRTEVPAAISRTAKNLVEQAQLLTALKIVLEQWARYVCVYSAIAIGVVNLYDRVKPRWHSFTMVLGWLLPVLGIIAITLLYPIPIGDLPRNLFVLVIALAITGGFTSMLLLAIVWTIRDGWWTPVQPLNASSEISSPTDEFSHAPNSQDMPILIGTTSSEDSNNESADCRSRLGIAKSLSSVD